MNTEKSTRRADTARLAPRELRTLRKYPNLLREARHLIKACKTVMRQVEALHDYTNARKRATAYRKILKVCSGALERIENK